MSLVDSHCHLDQLDLSVYNGSLSAALNAAAQVGVEHFLCVCIDMNNSDAVLKIAQTYPQVSASIGVHPTDQKGPEPSVDELITLASNDKVVAIGETGLDYYRVDGATAWQQARFRRHIQAAKAVHKPLIIHTRDAREDTLRILQEEHAETVGGVLHCFTESIEMARAAIAMGFYISFSGIITFKNAVALQAVVKEIPFDRLLIETDAPYLAPVPYRGKSNEPAYVYYVAEQVALLRGISIEAVAQQTRENFYRLFPVQR